MKTFIDYLRIRIMKKHTDWFLNLGIRRIRALYLNLNIHNNMNNTGASLSNAIYNASENRFPLREPEENSRLRI